MIFATGGLSCRVRWQSGAPRHERNSGRSTCAVRRIGEISRELEKAERARTDLHPTAGKQTKAAALAEAGISTSAAHRYEELTAGRRASAILKRPEGACRETDRSTLHAVTKRPRQPNEFRR